MEYRLLLYASHLIGLIRTLIVANRHVQSFRRVIQRQHGVDQRLRFHAFRTYVCRLINDNESPCIEHNGRSVECERAFVGKELESVFQYVDLKVSVANLVDSAVGALQVRSLSMSLQAKKYRGQSDQSKN